MPAYSGSKSVYSTASHLLSPTSLGSSSAPSEPGSRSASPSPWASSPSTIRIRALGGRPNTPFHPPERSGSTFTSLGPSGSAYPSSNTSSRLQPRPNPRQHPRAARPRDYRSSSETHAAQRQPRHEVRKHVPPPSLPDYGLPGYGREHVQDDMSTEHDTLGEIIMAIDMDKDDKVGCAYYIALDETLYLEEDVAMGGLEAAETLVLRVQPTTIIVPNRAPGPLIELLERDAHRLDEGESSGENGSYIFRHLGSAEFDYDTGREQLADLDLGPRPPDALEVFPVEEDVSAKCLNSLKHAKLTRLSETVNLDSLLSIGCAGAVLNDIERRRAVENSFPEDGGTAAFHVKSIKTNTPENIMLVSADALISLQILRAELHPNPQTQFNNTSEARFKESLSVYGLFQSLACTSQGKARLRQMLFRPSTDIGVIQERQQAIGVLLRPENRETAVSVRKLLKKVKNSKTLLRYVKIGVDRIRGQLSIRIAEWRAMLRFAMVSTQIKEAVASLSGSSRVALFSKIGDSIDTPSFLSIGELILGTIDFELSTETGHTEITQGASQTLDGLKAEFARICQMLPEANATVRREAPPWATKHIRHCTILPELGFLVGVTLDSSTGQGFYFGQGARDGPWDPSFVNGDLVYYKNAMMLNLDAHYGDLPSRIAQEEIEVMMELAAAVLQYEESIISASDLFGELDSMISLAMAAERYKWAAPQMTCENVVEIVDGRHPLQELLVPTFIPNSCSMEGGNGTDTLEEMEANAPEETAAPSMLVLTGPNNSGKSVYMRQVAITVFLAHIGSYVPATRARIGITDRILTRIATRETVADDESAFMVDLKQAAFTLNFGTRRSLILADEFGKGTSTETGAALFASFLVHFLDLGPERPKVLAGTHFHHIFERGIIEPGRGVDFVHMAVHHDPNATDAEDQVTFLFQLKPGRSTASLGVMCAAMNDVDTGVIKRAEDLVRMQEGNEDLEELCSGISNADMQRLVPAELIARRFLAMGHLDLEDDRNRGGNIRDRMRRLLDPTTEDDTSSLYSQSTRGN